MTFLELVKRLASETGTELESKITSVLESPANAYGESTEHRTRLIRWVKQAWLDVQEDQEQWNFMVRRTTMPLVQNQWSYDIKSIVDAQPGIAPHTYEHIVPFVAPRDFRYIWIVDGGVVPATRNYCYYLPPETFYGFTDRNNDRNVAVPFRYSFRRDGCIEFDAKIPDSNHFIEFEFRVEPQVLVDDGDVPRGLPERFHEVILYRAMTFYSLFDESEPAQLRAHKLYRDKMNKLRNNQLREYSLPGSFS